MNSACEKPAPPEREAENAPGRPRGLLTPERLHCCMFWLLWLYIVIFSAGPIIREALPSVCLILLLFYYRCNWRHSVLRRFAAKPLFLAFFASVLVGVVFSQDIWASFVHVGRGANKAFILPFVAMECVRDEKDLRRLIWAITLASLWQGCNGVWQSVTGFDFIDHTAIISRRLTGSLSDYRVGNYMALILIPASAVWFLLRERFSLPRACAATAILLGPGLYLLFFSYTRNGYLTLIAGASLWLLLREGGGLRWKPPAFAVAALSAVSLLVPERLGFQAVSHDGRWELWRFAWAIFREFPLTGAGFGRYNAAFRELGYVPTHDAITIEHPHDIYLQLLCESGVTGATLMCVFLLGMAVWGYRQVLPPLAAELRAARRGEAVGAYWRITALLWCAWAAYLLSGIFGHDFFRIWWQALVMTHLGLMIGAVVNGTREEDAQQPCAGSRRP